MPLYYHIFFFDSHSAAYLIIVVVTSELGLDLSKNSFLFRQPVRAQLGGVRWVGGNLRALRQQVVALVIQTLVGVGADHIRRATVGVIGGVSFLTVRDREVL